MRIVSTVPSQTELLFDLGLDAEVVGITKFCEHPLKWQKEKVKIGGTKNLNIEKIQSLHPDWIFSNKEENIKEQIEALDKVPHHYTSDVYDLKSALNMIKDIGDITNKSDEANAIAQNIIDSFSNELIPIQPKRSCIYLIWQDPYMSVGHDTFIHDMLTKCGWHNVMEDHKRYPSLSIEEIHTLNPDDILLSSEPYPFKEIHIQHFKSLFPNKNILLVDGTYFSWYGSRLQKSPQYFNTIIRNLY